MIDSLNDMRELVCKESASVWSMRIVLTGTKDNGVSDGVRSGIDRIGGCGCFTVRVDSNGAEIASKVRFHERASFSVEASTWRTQYVVHRSRYRDRIVRQRASSRSRPGNAFGDASGFDL